MDRTALTYIVQCHHNINGALLSDTNQGSAAFLRDAREWLDHAIDYLQKPHQHKPPPTPPGWVEEGGSL